MKFEGEWTRSVAEPIVLQLLSEQKRYGYEIIKVVNERSDNAFQWREGTLYPCLHRLEGQGWIESEWGTAENGKRRKYYKLTRKGRKRLAAKTGEWAAFASIVDGFLRPAQLGAM